MHAESQVVKCRTPDLCASCVFATLIFVLAPPAIAAKLGDPYYVDDAEIGKLGSCEKARIFASTFAGTPATHNSRASMRRSWSG
jgi:hypothetical protein